MKAHFVSLFLSLLTASAVAQDSGMVSAEFANQNWGHFSVDAVSRNWGLTESDTDGITFGVQVQGLTSPEGSSDKKFTLASVTKLFTIASANEVLSPEHTFVTKIGWSGTGELARDLTIVSDGDPYAAVVTNSVSADTARERKFWYNLKLQEIVNRLKASGVRRVTGKLRLLSVDSRLDEQSIPYGTDIEEITNCWGALTRSFNLNGNCIPYGLYRTNRGQWSDRLVPFPVEVSVEQAERELLRTRPVYDNNRAITSWKISGTWIEPGSRVPSDRPISSNLLPVGGDGREWWANHLKALFRQNGISAQNLIVEAGEGDLPQPRFTLKSITWRDIRKDLSQHSVAFLADAYFKALGLRSGRTGSLRQAAIDETLERAKLWLDGIDQGQQIDNFQLRDGTGMTARNMATPEALVSFLEAWKKQEWFPSFLDGLPIAGGTSGTLASRFQNSPAKGHLRAKTGTLNGRFNLAGYIPKLRNGNVVQWVPFAIFTETTKENKNKAFALQEKLVNHAFRKINP